MKVSPGERQRLRAVLSSIGDGVITTDREGVVSFMNPVAEALVGWTSDEAIGQPLESVFRIVNESTRLGVESPATRALREGAIVGLANHTILITRDGTERPIDDSAAPIRDARGRVTGCVLVFRDVTEKRRFELALERSERELSDFFDNANVGLHWVGPDGVVLRVNQAELDLLGYSRDEYVGCHISEFHVDAPVIEDILARLLRGEMLNEYPARMRCKDGSVRHVLINSTGLWEDGKFVHSRCFTLDVTDRKRADEAQALLAAIVAASDDAILSISLDGVIKSWNAGAERLYGFTESEAIGQPVALIIPPERHDDEQSILARLRDGERIDHYETVRLSRDGRRIDVSLTVSPVYDDSGRIIVGASKVGRDITERKRAEKALRDAEERKDEFLAVLGHELRNPLAPLRTGVDLLKHAAAKPELIEGVRSMMDRQLGHMTRLVDDLLDLSRISSGKLELRRTRLDIQGVIDAAVELTKPMIDEHDHALTVTHAGVPLPVDGDFERLTQVVGNLLSNAAKYMEPGGTIAVETEAARDQAFVHVRDSGFGIPPERLDQVFEMFTQVPEHRARTGGGGVGIGLALSRRLLALHGGGIEASSEGLGHGSEFTVHLPLAALPEDGSEVARPVRPAARPAAQRILIVDDNMDAAETLRLALEIEGHTAESVHDGPAALAALERFGPDTVLLDIGLPQMDGYEVARRIRNGAGGHRVRLIAVTGWGQEEDRQRTDEAGFDEHLTKPVTVEQLISIMECS